MGRNHLELAEGGSLASEGGKKGGIGCVMQALKCSSRATKEDNPMASAPLSLMHDGVLDLGWTDFGTANADFSANAFRLPASSERGDSNVPQQNTRIECEDTSNATTELEKAVDYIPLTVNRILSDDTHDTHDTPPVSNLDPNRLPADELSPKANKLQLDAICSKYFNTPVGQPMHSTAPLGDSISPVESPIEEDDEEEELQEATSSEFNEAKVLLQIPKMGARFVRTESEVSSLLGEAIAEEKKTADEQLLLSPDNASVKIGYQEVKATKSKNDSIPTRTLMRPSQKAAHRDSWTSESSSHSSVSSFSALRSNTPLSFEEKAKPLTPHTFFWRTYPKVTVTSYNYNTQQTRSSNERIPPRIDEEQVTDMTALASPSSSMGRQAKGPKYVSTDEIRSEAECAPFLNADVVRKLWMENRPFRLEINSYGKAVDQESQNPQPTRPRQLVQSFASIRLPAVFNRGEEIQQPEDLNFAMG
jgi:hypothetical protein